MLAAGAVDALRTQNQTFRIDEGAIARGVKARLPGRLEKVQEAPTVIPAPITRRLPRRSAKH